VSGQDDFATALEAIMARKREELGEPPTPEELLAYRDGRLAPAARDLLEARIAVHPDAARALADLAAFPDVEPEPGAPDLSAEEIDFGWEAFRRKLEKLPKPAPAPTRRPTPGSSTWRLAAAAVLLLTVGLVTGYLAGRASRSTPGSEVKPHLNVTIAELAPVGDEEESLRAPTASVELPPESEELLLILSLPETRPFASYTAEIHDREGRRLWSGEGLRLTPLGTFQLSFPRDAFAAGTYRIDVFGVERAGRPTKVARYELALTPDVE